MRTVALKHETQIQASISEKMETSFLELSTGGHGANDVPEKCFKISCLTRIITKIVLIYFSFTRIVIKNRFMYMF